MEVQPGLGTWVQKFSYLDKHRWEIWRLAVQDHLISALFTGSPAMFLYI